jgi:hypothetical protein
VSTVALSGSWTLDDNGTLLLNGNQLATLGVGNWGALYGVSVAAGSSDFQLGLNTLSINLPSSDFVLEGARFDGSLSNYVPASAVPEPTTVVGLLSLGLMGALVCLWRFGRSWAASVRVA